MPETPTKIESNPTDAELLRRALGGDEIAFTTVFRQRQAEIFRFGLQMTGDAAVADDVVQETFLTLLRVGDRYDPVRGPLRAFLFGIARKLVLRHLERGFRSRHSTSLDDNAHSEVTGEIDLLDDLTRRETIETIRRAVLTLPAVYRETIVLCDLQDASYEEASVALDCPVGTVRSRLNRGRNLLAKKLGLDLGMEVAKPTIDCDGSTHPAPGNPMPAMLRSIE